MNDTRHKNWPGFAIEAGPDLKHYKTPGHHKNEDEKKDTFASIIS